MLWNHGHTSYYSLEIWRLLDFDLTDLILIPAQHFVHMHMLLALSSPLSVSVSVRACVGSKTQAATALSKSSTGVEIVKVKWMMSNSNTYAWNPPQWALIGSPFVSRKIKSGRMIVLCFWLMFGSVLSTDRVTEEEDDDLSTEEERSRWCGKSDE